MRVPKTIPAISTDIDVKRISIDTENRAAHLVYKIEGKRAESFVPIMPIYEQGTAAQKTAIKSFLKQIVANGLDVDITDIPDIFN
jgi:hypothetical protein